MARALRDEAANQAAGAAAPGGAEPLVDLDFRRGGAAALGLVTCLRPTPGTVEDSRGVWRVVPADTPRLSDCGLLVEEARTNWIRNNAMAGAAEGTPGDLPTHWSVTLPEGCAGRVVETGTLDGIDYIDLGVTGEARGGSFAIAFEPAGAVPAAAAQAWACSAFFQVVSDDGEVPLSAPRLAVSALTATGNEIEAATVNLAPERFERAHVIMRETPAGTTSLVPHLAAGQAWSGAVDFVVRIGWPQLELGSCPTSPIRTAGATATRDADHLVAPLSVAGPCTIVAEFTAAFATIERQSERRVVWELRDGKGRTCALVAGDAAGEGHPILAIADETGRGVARSVRGFEAGALLRVGATLSSDVIESGCVALNGTPNSLLKGWLGGADAALTLGRDASGQGTFCGTLRRLTIYPRALGISELMALTRPLRGEAAVRPSRTPAQAAIPRAPEPEPEVPAAALPVEEPASARQEPGPLAAAARRLFAFRRRTDPVLDTPGPAPEPREATAPETGPREAMAAGHEPERTAPAASPEPEPEPHPALLAAQQQVSELEARLVAEQARAEALERAHQQEHAKFAEQIATLEATFLGARADTQASAQAAAETVARLAELEAARSALQADLDEARGRASELEAALTAERARAAELDERARSHEERQPQVEADLEAARRRAAEAQMQAAVEQAARTRSEAEQARLERRIESLQAGIEETRALAAASARVASEEAARAAEVEAGLRQELDEARRHGSELEAALAAERALWAEHERSAEEERAEVERRMAQLDGRAEEALARAAGMTERLTEAEARRAELAQALEEAQTLASALTAKLESEEALRTEREQAHEDERALLLRDVAALESRAAAAEERAAALDARAAELAAVLDKRNASEQGDNADLGAVAQAHHEEREALQRHVRDLQERLDEALSRAAAGADRMAALDDAQAALAERLDQARVERAELAERVEAAEAERARLERGHAEARDASAEQLAALQVRVAEALSQASAAAGALAAVEQQRAALAAALEDARRRAAEVETGARAEATLPRKAELEHKDESDPRTEELARVRTQLEALLAADSSASQVNAATIPAEPAPAQQSLDGHPVAESSPAAAEARLVAEDGPAQPTTTTEVEHQPGASSEERPRRSWRAGVALVALAAGAALGAVMVVQPQHRTAMLSAVTGVGSPPSRMALSPPYVPTDGVTFSAGFDTVRLAGLDAPSWSAACRDTGGALWPCGLRAREALIGLIKARPVTCLPAASGQQPLAASCALDGQDLGAMLVEQGWARPSDAKAYTVEAAEARRTRRGLWATGEWGASAEPSRTVGEAAGAGGRS
jgi:endonuclease YncB( thermonuclease family)